MKYAIIVDGRVVNVAVAAPEFAASQGWIELTGNAGIGWTWDGEAFSPPPAQPTVPDAVSMRQARLALLNAGLLQHVDPAIDAMDEPQLSAARIEWEYATELRRDHPLLLALGQALELTGEQIDALFVQAAAIE